MPLGPIHCGTFLLLAATVLLVVATISSPVVNNISFLNVYAPNEKATFGVFGYCINDACSPRKLGYNIASVTGTTFDFRYANTTLEGVTKGFILHPIAAGIAFLAFLIALCSDHLGFLFASLITLVAFLVSLVAMVLDFVVFGIIRREINNNSTNASAQFSTAIWLTMAATIVLFFSTFIVCFSCCGARRRSRDERYVGNGNGNGGKWWGNKY